MTIDSVPELARRVRHLETLVKRGKPADGSDNASLLKRISALESSVARIGKAAPTKPQVYTPKPAATVPKPANNSLAIKVSDHGALTGLADNDHPQYLLTTGKAADSDKLDNIDSSGFVQTSGNQTIAGIKTFSSFPVTPSSAPSSNYQTANKKYVDDLIGAWASWTPTITWAGGTTDPTSFTILAARYVTVGNLVFCMLRGSLTRGSGDRSYLSLTAPVTISNMASGSAHHNINGNGFVLAPLYSESGKVTIFMGTMTKDGYIWATWFYEKK